MESTAAPYSYYSTYISIAPVVGCTESTLLFSRSVTKIFSSLSTVMPVALCKVVPPGAGNIVEIPVVGLNTPTPPVSVNFSLEQYVQNVDRRNLLFYLIAVAVI